MLNETAKKLVARVARVAGREMADRYGRGANQDVLSAEAWQTAKAQNPDFRNWPSAQAYFEHVFSSELNGR